jgi:pimeloyl-ACP methyl ester carboxylesterase
MLRRSYIIGNDAGEQLHLVEAGQGPAVLLIHQTPRSWDEFREVIELLAPAAHLVAMDLPGMGASSPEAAPSIENYAAAAARVIEHIDRGPIVVCGHHTGGVVAIELAATRPDLVASLVLSSTPWVDAAAREKRAKKAAIDTVDPASGDRARDLRCQREPYYPQLGGYLDRFVCDALKAIDPATGHRAVGQYRMERAAPQIDCDVLLVEHGQDPFARDHTVELARALPKAVVRKIANGWIPLEATAPQFAAILRDWLGGDRSAARQASPTFALPPQDQLERTPR